MRIEDTNFEFAHKIIETRCTPENPFYLCWINAQDGWNCCMFSHRQNISRNAETRQTYNISALHPEIVSGFEFEYFKDGVEKIAVGTSGLNSIEYNVILKPVYSHQVEYLQYRTFHQHSPPSTLNTKPAFFKSSQNFGYDFVTTIGLFIAREAVLRAAGAKAIAIRWSL